MVEQKPEVKLDTPDEVDTAKIEEFKVTFSDRTREELEEILKDGEYLYEARKAAEELLNNM